MDLAQPSTSVGTFGLSFPACRRNWTICRFPLPPLISPSSMLHFTTLRTTNGLLPRLFVVHVPAGLFSLPTLRGTQTKRVVEGWLRRSTPALLQGTAFHRTPCAVSNTSLQIVCNNCRLALTRSGRSPGRFTEFAGFSGRYVQSSASGVRHHNFASMRRGWTDDHPLSPPCNPAAQPPTAARRPGACSCA